MQPPSAIIFINSEISDQQKSIISEQLFISETISFTEFNLRVENTPSYPEIIQGQNLRILVLCDNFQDYTNRNLADVVIFVKQNLASIEKNKFGPPGVTFDVPRIDIWKTLRGADSDKVIILPNTKPNILKECDCKQLYGLGGIFAIELRSSGISACKNPDSESNNQDFINRK